MTIRMDLELLNDLLKASSVNELSKMYRRIALKYHPDVGGSKELF